MRRYVNITKSASGSTTVTVSLVDGDLSSKWSTKTYTYDVEQVTKTADAYARKHLESIKNALEEV